ncbi:MAG: hypothetical protein R3D55_00665 [Chloroflexota bacterium]
MSESENSQINVAKKAGWKTAVNIIGPLLVTLVTLVLVIEIVFRLFYQLIPIEVCAADPIIGTYICQPYFEYDKPVRIGYRYTPNFQLEGLWNPANPYLANSEDSTAPSDRDDSFQYRFVTDDHGFPNEPAAWQTQYNLVVAGDSFTIRTAPTTWIERLEQYAGKGNFNAGRSSWALPQRSGSDPAVWDG